MRAVPTNALLLENVRLPDSVILDACALTEETLLPLKRHSSLAARRESLISSNSCHGSQLRKLFLGKSLGHHTCNLQYLSFTYSDECSIAKIDHVADYV